MIALAKENIEEILVVQSVGFGIMLAEGWETSINYALYEVSNHNIGIISNEPLEVGTQISIQYKENSIIPMVVHQLVPRDNLPPGYRRFRLISLDPHINFEKLLPETSHRKFSLSTRHHFHVRFVRFSTEIPTIIDAKTFGSHRTYSMKTLNISKSGFLLATPPGFTVPFHDTTLLELNIVLDEQTSIQCLGKVVRCEADFERKFKRYGINICEMKPEDREAYHSYIDDLEHRKNRQVFRLLKLTMPF